MKRNSLRHVVFVTEHAIEDFQGIGRIPAKERLYQFKITLKNIKPAIWRRFQTQGLHARQAPRTYPDVDGMDQFAPAPFQDRRQALR